MCLAIGMFFWYVKMTLHEALNVVSLNFRPVGKYSYTSLLQLLSSATKTWNPRIWSHTQSLYPVSQANTTYYKPIRQILTKCYAFMPIITIPFRMEFHSPKHLILQGKSRIPWSHAVNPDQVACHGKMEGIVATPYHTIQNGISFWIENEIRFCI